MHSYCLNCQRYKYSMSGAGPTQPICTHWTRTAFSGEHFGLGSCDFDFGCGFGFWHLITINGIVRPAMLATRSAVGLTKCVNRWLPSLYPTLGFIHDHSEGHASWMGWVFTSLSGVATFLQLGAKFHFVIVKRVIATALKLHSMFSSSGS